MTATEAPEAIDVVSEATTTVDPHTGPDQIGEQSTTAALAPLPAMTPANLTAPIASVEAARQAFAAYEQLRHTLITKDDVQGIAGKEFVKKSGWRKMAVVMGVSSEIRSRDYQRDTQGRVLSAEVIVRATAPNGRFVDGLGVCDNHERCCPRAYDREAVCKQKGYHTHCAEGCDGWLHFSKPQHDIPATASTRALNRACADLFGFGEVSAEEVTDKDEPADEADIAAIVHALNELAADQRGPAKHSFKGQFGMPAELKKGQVEAAKRFCKSLGAEVSDAPAAAGAAEDRAPSTGTPPTSAAPSAQVTEADSSAGGEGGDGSASEGDGPGSAVGSSPSQGPSPRNEGARPSTTVQRRNIGIRWKDLVAKELVTDADKAEYVAIVTGERARSTVDATFDEAVKLLAGIQLLSQGSISMVDDPEMPGARTLSTMPDSTLGPKFLASLPSGVRA